MAVQIEGSATAQSNASSNTYATTYPSGITAGELLVAHVRVLGSNTTPTWTDLQGFTEETALRTVGIGWSSILWKEADGTETGTAGFIGSIANGSTTGMVRISGQDATSFIDALNTPLSDAATSTTLVIPGLTTTVDGCLILWFAGMGENTTSSWPTPPSDANELYDIGGATTRAQAGAWESQTTAGATGTRTVTLGMTSANRSGQAMAIAPAAGEPPPPPGPASTNVYGIDYRGF